MGEKVSIIIPVYNQEAYLNTSLSTVINQTYQNIEIIIVNDGSNDSSLAILKEYAEQDKRIRIIDKVNGGLVDAILAGLSQATGEYICFLDPDDYLGTGYISNFMNNIGDSDFIAAGYYENNSGKIIEHSLKENKVYKKEELKHWRKMLLWEKGSAQISNRFFVSRWNKLYKTRCIKKIIEDFSQCRQISLGEDSLFTYLFLCSSSQGTVLKEPNEYYYNTSASNSMMSSNTIEMHLAKTNKAKNVFEIFLKKYGDSKEQALALYFFLIEALFQRLNNKNDTKREFKYLYRILLEDKEYQKALNMLMISSRGKTKMKLLARKVIKNGDLFLAVKRWVGSKQNDR